MKVKQKTSKLRAAILLAVMVCSSAGSVFAQGYGGPSMLSRGGNRPGQRGRAPVDIVVYGGLRGVLESGLIPVQLQRDGTFTSDTIFSGQVEFGAYGTHSWKKSILGLDYRGDYRKSVNSAYKGYDGTNQALSLDLQYQATRRTQILLRQIAGTSNRAFGGFAAPAFSDLQSPGLVNNEVFDTRVYYLQSSLSLIHQTSARTTWMAGGDGFIIKRPHQALVSYTGNRAVGAWNYRLNRRNSFGLLYTYMRFNYDRVFGGSETHGIAFQGEKSITRNLRLDLTAGVFRVDAFGTQNVQLSPEVAALLGRVIGVEAFNRRSHIPQIQATARYTLERSAFTASAMDGVSPGNGVYLTSRQTSLSAGYSYSGIRKLSLGLSGGFTRLDSVGLALSKLTTFRVGSGLNYRIAGHVNLSSQFDYRTFNSPTVRGREGYSLTFGFTVSPSRLPLSIW